MAKKLTRDTGNAFLGGVAAGFARYFDVDPVIARLAFVLLTLLHGAGVITYLICWVIMPVGAHGSRSSSTGASAPPAPGESPSGSPSPEDSREPGGEEGGPAPADRFVEEVRQAGERIVDNINLTTSDDGSRGQLVGGAILVAIGLIFLLPRLDLWFWPHWLNLWDFWPVILIIVGAAMLMRSRSGAE